MEPLPRMVSRVARSVGASSVPQEFAGCFPPGQGTCLGCGFDPGLGAFGRRPIDVIDVSQLSPPSVSGSQVRHILSEDWRRKRVQGMRMSERMNH